MWLLFLLLQKNVTLLSALLNTWPKTEFLHLFSKNVSEIEKVSILLEKRDVSQSALEKSWPALETAVTIIINEFYITLSISISPVNYQTISMWSFCWNSSKVYRRIVNKRRPYSNPKGYWFDNWLTIKIRIVTTPSDPLFEAL